MIKRTAETYNLKKAFFPVEERPICLDDSFMGIPGTRICGYKAIVECDTNRVLSVVSSRYNLIRNEDAYQFVDYVVREVFDGKSLKDFECFNIYMPKSKASCRIDLIIPNNFNKLFGSETESWTPFVRISNSYNRTVVLKYEIGFCRWICLNGMIFGQTGITFSLNHSDIISRREIESLIDNARKRIGNIGSLWNAFENNMERLRKFALPSSLALSIFCKVFEIKAQKDGLSEMQAERLSDSVSHFNKISQDYFECLGDNAYAMMNVLTDYASYPVWAGTNASFSDIYQRRVGKWIDEFLAESQKPEFCLLQYIGNDYRDTAQYLEMLVK